MEKIESNISGTGVVDLIKDSKIGPIISLRFLFLCSENFSAV